LNIKADALFTAFMDQAQFLQVRQLRDGDPG
jgi:hypothetical protein